MVDKITYTCGKCGWNKSLTAMWQDIKPKKCPRPKCKTSFIREPQMLQVSYSKVEASAPIVENEEIAQEIIEDEEKVAVKESKRKNKY